MHRGEVSGSAATPPSNGRNLAGPQDVSTRAELGELLTELRRRCGLSLRELAQRVGSSPSTVSGWCRAKNLPFPAQTSVFEAMLAELGVDDPVPWLDALARLRPSSSPGGDVPYRGLEAFGWDDRGLFFGREELLERVRTRLADVEAAVDRPRLVLLVGASGAGKSSLLHAGLWPQLAEEGRTCVATTPSQLADDGLGRWVGTHTGGPTAGPPVLLLDQFEEVATALSTDRREALLDELASLVDTVDGPSVVAAVRAELVGELVASGRLDAAIESGQVLVGPMRPDELRRAIVEPVRAAGVSVDDELVELLVRTFAPEGRLGADAQAGALPLLSHALLETWNRSSGARLTVADYLAAGGVEGAVERSAEAVFASLDDADRDVARQLFLRLVHVDESGLVTRRPTTYAELDGLEVGSVGRLGSVFDRFVDARLIIAGADHVELAHEALLSAWPRLAGWIEDAREGLRVHRRLVDAARMWEDSGRETSALARGTLLAQLRDRAEDSTSRLQLNQRERAFLDASITEADAQEAADRRRARRLRLLAGVSALAALAAVGLAVVAVDARSSALQARDEALSRQVAITAQRLSETDPLLGAQLAVAGYQVASTSEARSALLDAAAGPRGGRWLGGPGSSAVATADDGSIVAVSNSADAAVQLYTSEDGGLVRAGSLDLDNPDVAIFALALAPDRATLAVGDSTGQVTLWDVGGPQAPVQLAGPLEGLDNAVQELTFADGGDILAVAGAGPGVLRFDVADPRAPTPVSEVAWEPVVWSVATEAASGRLAFGAEDGEVQVWDGAGDGDGPAATVTVDGSDVLDVALGDAGRLLAASSRDGTVGVWQLSGSDTVESVELADATFTTWVNAVTISDDGAWLAAGSSNGTVRVWSTDTWTPVTTLAHPAAVTDLSFVEDTLVSAAVDGTMRVWEFGSAAASLTAAVWNLEFDEQHRLYGFTTADTGRWELGADGARGGQILEVSAEIERFSGAGAASTDGRWLAQGRRGGEVLLYDISTHGTPQRLDPPLTGAGEQIERLAFSPDNQWLATIGENTHLWELGQAQLDGASADGSGDGAGSGTVRAAAVELTEPTEGLFNLDWHPSGRLLAVASADGRVYLYRVDASAPEGPADLVAEVDGPGSDAYAVAFHPDGELLAAAGTDGQVRRWDVADPASPTAVGEPIVGPPGRIFDLAFDPTGRQLAAAAVDGSTWVWTLDDSHVERYAVLGTGGDAVYTVAFSHDREYLAAGTAGGFLHTWQFDADIAIDDICTSVGDPITPEEWNRHLPGRSYDPPCDAGGTDG